MLSRKKLRHELKHDFGIHHATVQIEMGDGNEKCEMSPDEVVQKLTAIFFTHISD